MLLLRVGKIPVTVVLTGKGRALAECSRNKCCRMETRAGLHRGELVLLGFKPLTREERRWCVATREATCKCWLGPRPSLPVLWGSGQLGRGTVCH